MPIKMIVTDLDGTLLRSDKTISEYTVSVLSECRAKGIMVVFATARPKHALKNIVFEPDYLIVNNGASVWNGSSYIHSVPFSKDTAKKMIMILRNNKEIKSFTYETGDVLYTNCTYWQNWGGGWNPVLWDFTAIPPGECFKMAIECSDNLILSEIFSTFSDLHYHTSSGEDWHIVTSKNATKLNGICIAAKELNIPVENIAAFGDDFNDIEMLSMCGTGVAVSNAIDEAKAAADYICDTNNNDGVAKWLAEMILQ